MRQCVRQIQDTTNRHVEADASKQPAERNQVVDETPDVHVQLQRSSAINRYTLPGHRTLQ